MKPNQICINHPAQKAISFCSHCHDWLCSQCVIEGRQHYYCRKPECLKALNREEALLDEQETKDLTKFPRHLNPNIRSYGNAFCWTLVLLAFYFGLYQIPLPTYGYLDQYPIFKRADFPKVSILALGLMPVFSSFFFVELLSLILKPLRGWRSAGTTGREKINLLAWGLSFFWTMLQAFQNNQFLVDFMQQDTSSISGLNPISFKALNVSALMGGTFICVWIAQLITQKGIGNGFLILFFYGWIKTLCKHLWRSTKEFSKFNLTGYQAFSYLLFFCTIFFVGFLLWRFTQKTLKIPLRQTHGKMMWFEVSPLPMSTKTHTWAIGIISFFTQVLIYAKIWDERMGI
ncbi:MAG TPA: hypothetical protein VK859_06655, partial [bacterium]|nr:hypothetical protein [bacterium]